MTFSGANYLALEATFEQSLQNRLWQLCGAWCRSIDLVAFKSVGLQIRSLANSGLGIPFNARLRVSPFGEKQPRLFSIYLDLVAATLLGLH